MRVRQTGPQGATHAIETINMVRDQLEGTRSAFDPARGRDEWLRWWENMADPQLRSLFTDTDLASSLYLAQAEIRNLDLTTRPAGLINHLTEVWLARLDEVTSWLWALLAFTAVPGRIVVPDTSAFIEGAYFDTFDWQSLAAVSSAELVRLIVPILVIGELDELKRDRNLRVSGRARSVLRRLWELHDDDPAQPASLPGRRATTIEVFLDEPWHRRRPVNDEEIAERTRTIAETTGHEVILAACDHSMLYCGAAGTGLRPVLMPRPSDDENSANP